MPIDLSNNSSKKWNGRSPNLSLINSEITKTKDELASIDSQMQEGTTRINELNTAIQSFNTQLRAVPLDEQQGQVAHWTTTVAVNSRGVSEAERRYNEFLQSIATNKSALNGLLDRLIGIKKQLE